MKKTNWYRRWHRNPLHAYVHWGALALVVGLFVLVVDYHVMAATKTTTQPANQTIFKQNPNTLPPDLKAEYQQIEAQIRQYTALVNQAKSIYDTGLACERACPCGANACPAGTDETTGRSHDQCITTCDVVIPDLQAKIAQLKQMETGITQEAAAFKQKLAALKPSDLYPLPVATACGADGKVACSESEARDYLLENPEITINKQPCTATRKKDCTSVGNMRPETLDAITQLQEDCHCSIRITAGTENILHKPGTYSHENGYKFDMSNDASHADLNKYIVNNCTADNNCKVDYRDKAKKEKRYTYSLGYETVEYVDESSAAGGSHWDVSVVPSKNAVKTPAKKK